MVIDYGRRLEDLRAQGEVRRSRAGRRTGRRRLLEEIEEARREWRLALRYLGSVQDPELVEHAAYLVKATERRYLFLVRRSRRNRSGNGR
jgi:hypothetical protein